MADDEKTGGEDARECAPPRAYNLGRRKAGLDETKAKILAAARELILSGGAFTVDAVAQTAGVARMTVYHRFGSKQGILEALFDSIALRGGMDRMGEAFGDPDPVQALTKYFEIFARFWGSDRAIMRRLIGAAALDADLARAAHDRAQRRREGVRVLARRLSERYNAAAPLKEWEDLLFTLTSFETFDTLAGDARTYAEAAAILCRAALAALTSDVPVTSE